MVRHDQVRQLMHDQVVDHKHGCFDDAPVEVEAVSYTHLRAHETVLDLVCRLLLENKKKTKTTKKKKKKNNTNTQKRERLESTEQRATLDH